MKKSIVWLCCLILTLSFAMPALSAGVLPDPGQYFSKEGKLDQRGVKIGNTSYDVYVYDIGVILGISTSAKIQSYLETMLPPEGFTWTFARSDTNQLEPMAPHESEEWYALTYMDQIAYLSLYQYSPGISFSSGSFQNGSSPRDVLTLYVPEGMAFNQYTYTPSPYDDFFNNFDSTKKNNSSSSSTSLYGGTSFLNDSFLGGPSCGDLAGRSHVSRVTCSSCHGSRKCSICGGAGKYRNPYTGSWLTCNCNNGKCSVCDGKGYW